MRLLGLILIAFAVLFEVLGIGLIIATVIGNGPNPMATFIFGGVLLAMGTPLLILGILVLRRGKPWEGNSTVRKGTKFGQYIASEPVDRLLDGVTYTTLYTPATKGKNKTPSVLKLSVPIEVDGEFEIVPESRFDRFAKHWGLATEIRTGDDTFDESRFVRSDTTEFTEAYLANPDNRAIIGDLHRLGFKNVTMNKRKIFAAWSGFDPLVNDTPDLVEEVGARLILLARKMPDDFPDADQTAVHRRRFWQIVIWVGMVVFATSFFSIMPFTPLHASDLLVRALPVFLIGYPGMLFAAAMLLRGTSRSHYAWFAIAIGGLVLMPLISLGAINLLNGYLDRSPGVEHRARIVRKYTTKSKNTTTYHVQCDSWRTPGDTEAFKVSSSDYGRIAEGRSHMLVETHAGALGIEWIESKQVEIPAKGR